MYVLLYCKTFSRTKIKSKVGCQTLFHKTFNIRILSTKNYFPLFLKNITESGFGRGVSANWNLTNLIFFINFSLKHAHIILSLGPYLLSAGGIFPRGVGFPLGRGGGHEIWFHPCKRLWNWKILVHRYAEEQSHGKFCSRTIVVN